MERGSYSTGAWRSRAASKAAAPVALLLVLLLSGAIFAGVIQDTLSTPAYTITKTPSGTDAISWTGAQQERGTAGTAGTPDLPTVSERIALPINADGESVKLTVTGSGWQDVAGTYDIAAVPMPAGSDGKPAVGAGKKIENGRDVAAYSTNAYLPAEPATAHPYSQARKLKFVTVNFCPFRYNPVTKKLQVTNFCQCQITFRAHGITNAERKLLKDTVVDTRLEASFKNRGSADSWYKADASGAPAADRGAPAAEAIIPDSGPAVSPSTFVVITTSTLVANLGQLSSFLTTKQSEGFSTLVVDESVWGGGTGTTASTNIRNWLKNNYVSRSIRYVLLIGDPYPTTGSVPMRLCWPRHGAGSDEQSVTDYYYADLTGNWDKDGDGYFGEYPDDTGTGGVDLAPEVIVGRIPFYGNFSDVDTILSKLITYETATGDLSWRKTGLIAAAISNFNNEDSTGEARTDGSPWGEACKADIFNAVGGASWRMYEQAGLTPVTLPCDQALTEANLVARWNVGYGFVTWWAHGAAESASRKTWGADTNANGVPEAAEMTWYPMITTGDAFYNLSANTMPIVTECSCDNGTPEDASNLQFELLRNGAIGTVGASRVSWYAIGTWSSSWYSMIGDNAAYGYCIPRKMLLEKLTLGEANHWCRQNFGLQWYGESYMNVYDFNVYGDPSLSPFASNLVVATRSLAAATAGVSYSDVLSATGGTVPYSWSITGGTLPAGLSLDTATGAITGTPTTGGTSNITVRVTDSQAPAASATKALSITVTGAATYAYLTSDPETSTTNTNYVMKVNLTLNTAVTDDWIIFGFCEFKCPNVNYATFVQLFIDAAGEGQNTRKPVDPTDYLPFISVKVKNLTAGSHTIQLKYRAGNAAAAAYVRNARVCAVRKGSLEFWNVANDGAKALSVNSTDIAVLTWTPAVQGNYLVISTAELNATTAVSTDLQTLYNGVVNDEGIMRAADDGDYTTFMSFNYCANAPAGVPITHKIMGRKMASSATNHYIRRARILALRLSQSRFNSTAAGSSTEQTTALTSWQQALTTTWTIGVSGKWLFLNSARVLNTSTSYQTQVRVQLNNTTPNCADQLMKPKAANDLLNFSSIGIYDLTTPRQVDMDFRTSNAAGTAKVRRNRFYGLPLDAQ